MTGTSKSKGQSTLQTLLRPGRWFFVALLVWWLLRAAGLYAMRAFGELPFAPGDFATALLFDGLLLWGLFLRARAHRLLGASPSSALRTWLRPILAIEVPVLALVMTTLRVTDVIVCYFNLAHLTETTWKHVSPGSLGYASDPRVVGLLAGIGLVATALAGAAWRDARGILGVLDGTAATARRSVVIVLVAVGFAWGIPLATSLFQDQHPQHWAIVPEVNGVYTLLRAKFGDDVADPSSVQLPQLSDETVTALRKAGLITADQRPNGKWPMLRTGIGDVDVLPLARHATASDTTDSAVNELVGLEVSRTQKGSPPNVLILLVESLNAGFTGLDPRSRHPDAMPNLTRWAREMSVVTGYHNVASPTANGLVASFCATLPAAAVQEIEVGGSVDKGAAYRCISDVLREYGYRSHFARGASKIYMACEASLRSHGFDEVYGKEDLVKLYPTAKINSWGYYDATLVDFLLKEFDRLQSKQRPWLYTALTVNSHLPGFAEADCKPPADIARDSILTGYWCSDRAIDTLLRGMKARGLLDNTVVVITGDHAQLPTRKVQALIGQPELFGAFAPMPLLISDPRHRLPKHITRLSSQLDLAPTLLHLLGADVSGMKHSFMGYSIFGERRRHPLIVGRTGRRSAYVQTRTARASLAMGTLDDLCEAGSPLLADGSAPITACALDAYYRWLDAVWAGHRLFPSELYNGGAGADAELLRLKWLRYDQKEERDRQKLGVKERLAPN